MCGIAGFLDLTRRSSAAMMTQDVRRMADALVHRGPDDSGEFVDERSGLALGFRRLSIIDLSPTGHQPMQSASGRYTIVFNGEIYNFDRLRQQLREAGSDYPYRGRSDTEVMLAAFELWGVKGALAHFNGMFGFALYDAVERKLTLVRDRAGEKPVYYGWCGNILLFGSELSALRSHPRFQAEIDRGAIALMMQYACIPPPYSIYEGIHKLMPAHLVEFSTERKEDSVAVRYWDLREHVGRERTDVTETQLLEELRELLLDAVKIRMVADVPVGAFLSGGIDSSLISAMMQAHSRRPIKTFSIGFHDGKFDEATYAKAVATHLGTDHTELYVTPADALSVIPKLPTIYSEPFADSSQIPTYLVAKLARKNVTVALTGDGGDEIFAGYHRHIFMRELHRVLAVPHFLRTGTAALVGSVPPEVWDSILGRTQNFVRHLTSQTVNGDRIHKAMKILAQNGGTAMLRTVTSHWPDVGRLVPNSLGHKHQWLDDDAEWPKIPFVQQVLYVDTLTYLPGDILVKVDRATMANSLEGRIPFLDHRVMQFAWSMPFHMRLRGNTGKWALRELLYTYVPRFLVERPKAGFAVPIERWLRNELREWAEELLDERRLRQQGYLNVQLVRDTWKALLHGAPNLQHRIWNVLMFQAWLEDANRFHPTRTETALARA